MRENWHGTSTLTSSRILVVIYMGQNVKRMENGFFTLRSGKASER